MERDGWLVDEEIVEDKLKDKLKDKVKEKLGTCVIRKEVKGEGIY